MTTERRTPAQVEKDLENIYEETFRIYRDLMWASDSTLPDNTPFTKMRQAISEIQAQARKLQLKSG